MSDSAFGIESEFINVDRVFLPVPPSHELLTINEDDDICARCGDEWPCEAARGEIA